jgi:hypothetical protein
MWQMVLVILLRCLSAGLARPADIYILPPEDGLLIRPKHVDV